MSVEPQTVEHINTAVLFFGRGGGGGAKGPAGLGRGFQMNFWKPPQKLGELFFFFLGGGGGGICF